MHGALRRLYQRAARGRRDAGAGRARREAAAKIGETLSGGQRRRLDVALALIGDPELIFLDEPTTGFDPAARRDAWKMLDGLRELGKTIFLTTHYMEEAERLADRIAVIAGGRIVAEGSPGTLGGRDRMGATIRFALPARCSASRIRLPASAGSSGLAGPHRVAIRTGTPLVQLLLLGRVGAGPWPRPARHRRAPPDARGRVPRAHRPGGVRYVHPTIDGALVLHQARYDLRAFAGTAGALLHARPAAGAARPSSSASSATGRSARPRSPSSTFYVPGLCALSIVAASFVNLVISITAQREAGVLRRRRATPVPAAS